MAGPFSNSEDFSGGGVRLEEEDGAFSLRDIYFVVFRHKSTILWIAGIGAVVALMAALFFIKPQFTSEAKLLVRVGRESVAVDRTAAPGESVRTGRSREEEIRTEMEIIKSSALAQKVVDTLGVDTLLQLFEIEHPVTGKKSLIQRAKKYLSQKVGMSEPDPDTVNAVLRKRLANGLMKSLQVNRIRDSSMFSVTFSARRPEAAAKVLDMFINKYLDAHISLHFTNSTYLFLKEQTEKLRSQLSGLEEQLKNYKKIKMGEGAYNEEQISDRIEFLEQQLIATESELASAEGNVKVLRQRLKNSPIEKNGDKANHTGIPLGDISRRLSDLKIQEQELLSVFTEQSTPVREIRRQISELQKLLSSENQSETVVSPVVQAQMRDALELQLVNVEGSIAALRKKIAVLQKQRKEAKNLMTEFNDSSTELAALLRDKEKYEISYHKYAESLEQARIDQALKLEKISNISIAQPPTRPMEPDKSKRKMILLGGLIGGLFAGIAMAYLRENMDDTLKRPEDIKKKLSIPVVASLPCFDPAAEQKKQDIFNIDNLDVIPKPSQTDGANTGNAQGDVYYEELMYRLFSKDDPSSGGALVVAVTSSRTGEGVTTIATRLATNLTRRGRVLLVDVGALKQQGGSSDNLPYKDLSSAIELNIESRPHENSMVAVNVEAFRSSDFVIADEIQCEMKKPHDFVILDLPSVLDDGSTRMLARLANQALLVIEAEKVRWQVLKDVCEKLTDAGVVIRGAVLNKRKYYIPGWLYRKL